MSQSDDSLDGSEAEPKLDPEVIEEARSALSEEQIIGMYGKGGASEERMPLVENWFPGADDWQGKTKITKRQAHALAMAKHLPEAFPEIDHLENFIHGVINDYEMLLTSVDGEARNQQMSVLKALFGGGSEDLEEARTLAMTALAGDKSDNDD